MSFYEDELRRINDAELVIMVGLSVRDLGYEEMSLQLEYDLLELKLAIMALERGKMPYQK